MFTKVKTKGKLWQFFVFCSLFFFLFVYNPSAAAIVEILWKIGKNCYYYRNDKNWKCSTNCNTNQICSLYFCDIKKRKLENEIFKKKKKYFKTKCAQMKQQQNIFHENMLTRMLLKQKRHG